MAIIDLLRTLWVPGGVAIGGGYAMYNNIIRVDSKTDSLLWIVCGSMLGLFITIPAYLHDRGMRESI